MTVGRPKKLNLALQGGGAHGAFTWGCLERLLDAKDIEIGNMSGTSAGALNGAALAAGYALDGRQGAKRQLKLLWHRIAQAGYPLTALLTPLRKPGMGIWDDMLPLTSPYQANPMGMGPLRVLLESVIDMNALRQTDGPRLFVNAVNVRTAQMRVFGPEEMSLDALLASACAPLMFAAVEVEREIYWDGSYGANPTLFPLCEGTPADTDILMVELTPLRREEVPISAKNILNRINEIASIHGLVAELRAIDHLNRGPSGASIRFHVLSLPEADDALLLEPSVKRTVGIELFEALRAVGYKECDRWLAGNAQMIGVAGSADLAGKYLSPFS